jgi:glycosyltransferase involved in cell wall biosynthesis
VNEILEQDRRDFELIVRINGSEDETANLLREIKDPRLRIVEDSQNIGTRTFLDLLRYGTGQYLTWISDEDELNWRALDIGLSVLDRDIEVGVAFFSIVVGKKAHFVERPDRRLSRFESLTSALSYSGCGGAIVRREMVISLLNLQAATDDHAYALWNNYPIGFVCFVGVARYSGSRAHSCSATLITQRRFAQSTNNWNEGRHRPPHYFPEAEFDRLISSILNARLIRERNLRFVVDSWLLASWVRNVAGFRKEVRLPLLKENYDSRVVGQYESHINQLRLGSALGRWSFLLRNLLTVPTQVKRLSVESRSPQVPK